MAAGAYFAATYSEARGKFLEACADAGVGVVSHRNPFARGPAGEDLNTDVAWVGPEEAPNVVVATSGTHGVEGYCGSGCQVGVLRADLHKELPSDTALAMVHAINPCGFAHTRRVTEGNVDLNRNFREHDEPPPSNDAYEEVHPMLVPVDWDGPARKAADEAIQAFIAERGLRAFQAAVTGGQYVHADGLFYGGQAQVWSNQAWRRIIRSHLGECRAIAYIDFHTGLGPRGYGAPIFVDASDSPALARARDWWGDDVTCPATGDSVSAVVHGDMAVALREGLGDAALTPIALEYGTLPVDQVLDALRGDNWLYLHGDPESPQGRTIKRDIRDAFYGDDDEWKSMIWDRAVELVRGACTGLAQS